MLCVRNIRMQTLKKVTYKNWITSTGYVYKLNYINRLRIKIELHRQLTYKNQHCALGHVNIRLLLCVSYITCCFTVSVQLLYFFSMPPTSTNTMGLLQYIIHPLYILDVTDFTLLYLLYVLVVTILFYVMHVTYLGSDIPVVCDPILV
jgi:hypothetical protein